MRSFLTYGFISLVGVAALYACGDDSGDGTTGPQGGSGGSAGSGAGGTAGNTSMAGNGGGGAAGSTGGTAGSGGAPPAPAANCQGCVQLTVPIPATPLDTANMRSQAQFNFNAAATGAPFDLTNVTAITWRVQALTTGANYYVAPYLQNAPPEDPNYAFGSYGAAVPLAAATFPAGMWVDVALNVSMLAGPGGADAGASDAGTVVAADAGDAGATTAVLTAFDKSKVRVIGLAVGGAAAAAGQTVSVEIDSVTVAGTSNFTTKDFATGVDTLTANTFYQFPPGSSVTAH